MLLLFYFEHKNLDKIRQFLSLGEKTISDCDRKPDSNVIAALEGIGFKYLQDRVIMKFGEAGDPEVSVIDVDHYHFVDKEKCVYVALIPMVFSNYRNEHGKLNSRTRRNDE